MFMVTMRNDGCVLDSQSAETDVEAAALLVQMILETGFLRGGDHFQVDEIAEPAPEEAIA